MMELVEHLLVPLVARQKEQRRRRRLLLAAPLGATARLGAALGATPRLGFPLQQRRPGAGEERLVLEAEQTQ